MKRIFEVTVCGNPRGLPEKREDATYVGAAQNPREAIAKAIRLAQKEEGLVSVRVMKLEDLAPAAF